jgi:hypothetical protein
MAENNNCHVDVTVPQPPFRVGIKRGGGIMTISDILSQERVLLCYVSRLPHVFLV